MLWTEQTKPDHKEKKKKNDGRTNTPSYIKNPATTCSTITLRLFSQEPNTHTLFGDETAVIGILTSNLPVVVFPDRTVRYLSYLVASYPPGPECTTFVGTLHKNDQRSTVPSFVSSNGIITRGEGGCTHFMHSRNLKAIDPSHAYNAKRNASGFHRPGRHRMCQARNARGATGGRGGGVQRKRDMEALLLQTPPKACQLLTRISGKLTTGK